MNEVGKDLYRYLVPGGILSPRELLDVIQGCRKLGLDGLHFGSRQDILLPLAETPDPKILPLCLISGNGPANIISSYVATDIFPKTNWITGATYLYIIEQIGRSRLEVNLADPRQRLTPLFTGHLNFIASPEEDFWYLYVQLPGWSEMMALPSLVHSWDIGKLVLGANAGAGATENLEDFVALINRGRELNLRGIDRDLAVPFDPFPYYEGMNRLDTRSYWLGLYWRNNWYNLDFLEACCRLALDHRIGKLCITPWKSFIISGIPDNARIKWEKLLGRLGINARHSSLELNWHLPVANGEALELKRFLVREFDRRDISTYGLTIGVGSSYTRPFTSILIDIGNGSDFVDGFAVRPTYNLRYARNFDPNTREYVDYARGIDRGELTELILELTKLYFGQLNATGESVISTRAAPPPEVGPVGLFACGGCRTVYDPVYGDATSGVAAGAGFVSLPADYACPVCGGAKAEFRPYEAVVATS